MVLQNVLNNFKENKQLLYCRKYEILHAAEYNFFPNAR